MIFYSYIYLLSTYFVFILSSLNNQIKKDCYLKWCGTYVKDTKKRVMQQEADFCVQQESASLNFIDNDDYFNN